MVDSAVWFAEKEGGRGEMDFVDCVVCVIYFLYFLYFLFVICEGEGGDWLIVGV